MKSLMSKIKGILLTMFFAFFATSSFAQVSIEEIIVTGLKRDATILDAPVAVTVFSADQIEKAGITRPEDYLALVPNVGYVTSNNQGEFFVNMRGMATVRFAEAAVAVVIDGIQLAINNEFNMDYFDIEQLEVLKGPQGALYGRNATAGAIVVKTRDPLSRAVRALSPSDDIHISPTILGEPVANIDSIVASMPPGTISVSCP